MAQVANLEAAYDVAAAQVKVARENHELARLGTRKEQIELARAQLAETDAQIRWFETQLENTVIRAPVDGTVLDRTVEKGEMFTTGFFGGNRAPKPGVASLANLKDLEVELDINEADIPRVRLGQQCSVSPDSYPDRKYKAVVREIAPEANRQKATIQVKVAILEVDAYLRPETNAKVNFLEEAKQEAAAESRILVPKGAVVTSQGSSAVSVMKDGRAVLRPEQPGKELWAGGDRLRALRERAAHRQGVRRISDGEKVAEIWEPNL